MRTVARTASLGQASADMRAATTGPGMARLALIAPDSTPMPMS